MPVYSETITLQTDARPEFYDITQNVRQILIASQVKNGILVVYSPHTTCTVIIQEDAIDVTYNGTKFIMQDLLDIFDKVVPVCKKEGQYMHPGPKCAVYCVNELDEPLPFTLNTDGHLRSVILGRSESIPVIDGELQLGEHGHIYFGDLDGTRQRERRAIIQVVGE